MESGLLLLWPKMAFLRSVRNKHCPEIKPSSVINISAESVASVCERLYTLVRGKVHSQQQRKVEKGVTVEDEQEI